MYLLTGNLIQANCEIDLRYEEKLGRFYIVINNFNNNNIIDHGTYQNMIPKINPLFAP